MKFARYISVIERDAPLVWQGKFINYKKLKKMLKNCRNADQPVATIDSEAENEFFRELSLQLRDISRYFQKEATRIIGAYRHRSQFGFNTLFCFLPNPFRSSQQRYAQLLERAYWCRKFARANAVALRKILKKHDKFCGNQNGREFLQQCWLTGTGDGIGLFLHSPLLDELKAIQEVLHNRISEIQMQERKADSKKLSHDIDSLTPEELASTLHEDAAAEARAVDARAAVLEKEQNQCTEKITNAQQQHCIDDELQQVARTLRQSPFLADLNPNGPTNPTNHTSLQEQQQQRKQSHELSRISSVSSEGPSLGGALALPRTCSGNSGISTNSFLSPSLRAQRCDALHAIEESPTFMLDSSELEWVAGIGLDGDRSNNRNDPERQRGYTMNNNDSKNNINNNTMMDAIVEEGDGDGVIGSSPGGGSSAMGLVLGLFRDEELHCPICLELMYKPVGLGCGHKFCRPCALEAAGFGSVNGAFTSICSYIPGRMPCPQCRQTNVYRNAVSLREVGTLIQSKYPDLWADRKAEDLEKRRKINEALSQSQRQRMIELMGMTPFDIINASSQDL